MMTRYILLEVGIMFGPDNKKVRTYMPVRYESNHSSPIEVSKATLTTYTSLRTVAFSNQLVDLTNAEVIKDRYFFRADTAEIVAQYVDLPVTPWVEVQKELENNAK